MSVTESLECFCPQSFRRTFFLVGYHVDAPEGTRRGPSFHGCIWTRNLCPGCCFTGFYCSSSYRFMGKAMRSITGLRTRATF